MQIIKYLKITKNRICFWFSYILSSTLITLSSVQAIPGLDILTAPFVFLAKLVVALAILAALSWGFLHLAQIILEWAANPSLIGNVTTNKFVLDGWSIIRDFSNLFFILILVAIGIATALRIKSYEVKKTLPRLIVAAVLINFSTVICGVVIDVANILMNFFMTAGAAGYGNALSLAQSGGNALITVLKGSIGDWSGLFTGVVFVKIIIAIAFNFFAAFVLIMFSVLFLMRNLMLWILVIFSPFAFVSAILPASKKNIYSWWIKNFLQWTFIGVIGAFFIYLSQLMLELGVHSLLTNSPSTDASAFGGKTISNFIVLTIPFIFLLVGYSVTLSFAPIGASATMNFVKGMGGKIYQKSKSAGIQRLRREARETGNKVYDRSVGKMLRRRAGNAEERAANRETNWQQATGVKKVGKAVSRTLLPYRTREFLQKRTEAITQESAISSIDKVKSEADKLKSAAGRRRRFDKAKTREERIAYIQSAIDNQEIDGYSDSEIQQAIKEAGQINSKLAENIMQSAPHLAQELYDKYDKDYGQLNLDIDDANNTGNITKARKLETQRDAMEAEMKSTGLWLDRGEIARYGDSQGEQALERKIVANTKVKDVGKFSKKYVNTDTFMQLIQDPEHQGKNAWGGNNLAKMAEEFGLQSVDLYNAESELLEQQKIWFEKNHPTHKWIRNSPGAAAAGYRIPEGKGNTPWPMGGIGSTGRGPTSSGSPSGNGGGHVPGGGGGGSRRRNKRTGEKITAEEIETDLGKIEISKKAKKQEKKFDRKKGEDIKAD